MRRAALTGHPAGPGVATGALATAYTFGDQPTRATRQENGDHKYNYIKYGKDSRQSVTFCRCVLE